MCPLGLSSMATKIKAIKNNGLYKFEEDVATAPADDENQPINFGKRLAHTDKLVRFYTI